MVAKSQGQVKKKKAVSSMDYGILFSLEQRTPIYIGMALVGLVFRRTEQETHNNVFAGEETVTQSLELDI